MPYDLDALLPQQGRWRILTRLLSAEADLGVAEADFDPAFAEGHFPEQAVVPGVALLEGLAQTLLAWSRATSPDIDGIPFLAGFDRVRFRAPVFPPATVRFEVRVRERRGDLTRADGVATWNGRRVCTAQLTGAVIPRPDGQTA